MLLEICLRKNLNSLLTKIIINTNFKKKLNIVKKIIPIILITLYLSSCGNSKPVKDETLTSFMLGGIYFINGYGGIESTNGMMIDAGYTSDADLISGYKQIFEFPFERTEKSGSKRVLKEWWDITDKTSLLEEIENLKTREYAHKAWDYARIVNNACIAYSAEYLSKDEVKKITNETLVLARKDFENWNDYYTNFDLGRKDWNPEDEQGESFESIAKNITSYPNSIYTILPLK